MRLIFIILLVSIAVYAAMGQDVKYMEAMKSNIETLYSAPDASAHDPIINTFIRIGEAEADQWEPYYYAALGYAFKSTRINEGAKKDEILDEGIGVLEKAKQISPENSELVALEGFLNMLKLTVDPGTRGQTLSPLIMASFSKAVNLNPNNPRALMFMAQMQMGTAQFFGSSIEEPCNLADKSIELFENSSPESAIAPAWGRESAMALKKACSTELSKTSNK